jgi:cyanophycin synthetase
MARPGDLLLIFGDQITRTWKQIIHFRPELGASPAEKPVSPLLLETHPAPSIDEHRPLVRDERGVRLAREAED